MATILGLLIFPSAQAASPRAHIAISGPSHGFTLKSERATSHNTYVARFASKDSAIDIVADAGTTVTFDAPGVLANGNHYLSFSSTSSPTNKAAPVQPVESTYDSLVDLGVSPAKASSFAQPASTVVTAAATTLLHSNYKNVCYTISQMNGLFTGYGCAHAYIEWKDPANSSHWGITSDYKVTIQGNNYTLKGVYWRIQWPSGNQLTDWEPYTTNYLTTNCIDHTVTVSMKLTISKVLDLGVADSTASHECPDYVGPWNPSSVPASLDSGAKWYSATGVRNVGMGVAGLQAIDSPASASAAFSAYYLIEY